MNKIIITVVGKDTVGIIAKVCTYLAENQVNILDISQTIVQEFFNMMIWTSPASPLRPFLRIWRSWEKRSVSASSARGKKSLLKCTGFRGGAFVC